jgi:hypothetical protein
MAKKKTKKKVEFCHWTPREIRILKKFYCNSTTREVAEKLLRTPRAIEQKAHTLGLYKSIQQLWSQDEVKRLRKFYPNMSSFKVAAKMGRTLRSIGMKASKLGLHKTKKYLKEQRRS